MGTVGLLLLPTIRLRGLLRLIADVEYVCGNCPYAGPLDIPAAIYHHSPSARLGDVAKRLPCPRCGGRRGGWRAFPYDAHSATKLQETVAPRVELDATCIACRRRWKLDLVETIRDHGPDVTLRNLNAILRCPFCRRCGWIRVGAAGAMDQGDERKCGRLAIHSKADLIVQRFAVVGAVPPIDPRDNAAPLQMLPVIRRTPETGERSLDLLRWGLVPVWSKDPSGAARMINARAESVAEKPAFRTAFKKRRCLVPFDNFYEWRTEGKVKQPYAIATTSNEKPDAFAGLWEAWKDPANGEWLKTFTIITTTANEVAAEVHDRMPVILSPAT